MNEGTVLLYKGNQSEISRIFAVPVLYVEIKTYMLPNTVQSQINIQKTQVFFSNCESRCRRYSAIRRINCKLLAAVYPFQQYLFRNLKVQLTVPLQISTAVKIPSLSSVYALHMLIFFNLITKL